MGEIRHVALFDGLAAVVRLFIKRYVAVMEVLAVLSAATQSPATGAAPPVDQPSKSWREVLLTGTDAGALTCTCAPAFRVTVQGVVQGDPSTVTTCPAMVLLTVSFACWVYRAVSR